MKVEDVILSSRIRQLEPSKASCIPADTTVGEAIRSLKEDKTGCLIITEEGRPIGVFTERDVLNKIAGEKQVSMDSPITLYMTEKPKTLGSDATLSDAISLMDGGSYRHVPIVDRSGRVESIISIHNIVKFLAELFPTEVLNLPPHPQQFMATREGG